MANEAIDGMLVVAKLGRGLLGGAVYRDVAIRREDGDIRRIGTITVLDNMRHALVPGTRGRFYAYDVVGSKGIYGFRPAVGAGRAYFPLRFEILLAVMGVLNLSLALDWYFRAGAFTPFYTGFGLFSAIFAVVFTVTRIAAMRTYRADDRPTPSKPSCRTATESA